MKEFMKKIRPYLVGIIFAGYILFNVILLWFHEPWRDEANVWLMARELSPLRLLQEIKYQGHPCLWYFLVMPFAKLGLPFHTIGILSTVIMAVAAWIYLQRSRQSLVLKVLVLFSPIFTYFYPTIARNYCLIALLVILLAAFYSERNTHPLWYGLLLGLLVQADTIAIAPAGMITLIWFLENAFSCVKEKNMKYVLQCLKGTVIPFISLLFWIVQFYQVSDSPVFEFQRFGVRELLTEVRNYMYIILIRLTGWSQMVCTMFFLVVFLTIAVLSVRIRNIGSAAVLLMNVLFQCVFSVMVYQLHIWHYLSLCFVFLWMIWTIQTTAEEKKVESDQTYRISLIILQVIFGILAIAMFLHWNSGEESSNLQNALYGSYSDGEYAADFIEDNIGTDDVLVTTNVCMESTIVAYLKDYRFYYAGNGQQETYADWSERQTGSISVEELLKWVRETFPEKEEVYLIQGNDSCISDSWNLDSYPVIYETNGTTARDEEYRIYKIEIMDGMGGL